jgi:hypothetical protein
LVPVQRHVAHGQLVHAAQLPSQEVKRLSKLGLRPDTAAAAAAAAGV